MTAGLVTHRSSASLKWQTFPETPAGEQKPPCGSPLRLTMDLMPLRKYPHSLSHRRPAFIYPTILPVNGLLQKLIPLSGNYEGHSSKAYPLTQRAPRFLCQPLFSSTQVACMKAGPAVASRFSVCHGHSVTVLEAGMFCSPIKH